MALEFFISAVISQIPDTKAPHDVFNNVIDSVFESGSIEESKENRLNVIVIDLLLILEVLRKHLLFGPHYIKVLLVY
jgi:hypothetical protein